MTSRKTTRRRALQNQIARLNQRLKRLQAQSNRFSIYRLLTFLAGMATALFCYYLLSREVGWALIAATLVAFNIIAYYHRRIVRSITSHEIWSELKSTQIARMDLNWESIPLSSTTPSDPEHPFEIDLDLTGKKSLHQLVDTAVSREGSARLKNWLLATETDLNEISRRQEAVRELTPLTRFRSKLWLTIRLVTKETLDGNKLLEVLSDSTTSKSLRWLLPLSAVLAVITMILFALNQLALMRAWWIVSLIVYGLFYFFNKKLYAAMMDEVVEISDELTKLKAILYYLENYSTRQHRHLHRMCQSFQNTAARPSAVLHRMAVIATLIGLRMNPMMRLLLNVTVPWDFFLARRLDTLKKGIAGRLPKWLDALYELEATNSLANFAYLNPDYAFPELRDDGAPGFSARKLGHPLIYDAQRVGNDFSFNKLGEIAIVTGSNMSGKSTFLKTIGVNLALAYAGGPVAAEALQTSRFRVFTCIKINDSVTDGFSFFYAEVRRLKRLLDELQKINQPPLLFLIDEIFRGTNNRERLIGSQSYIRALAGGHGVGMISTHDLELTKLAESIVGLTNYHFREEVVAGKMVFDFKLRLGPCPTTNALKIMQMEGLPVLQ